MRILFFMKAERSDGKIVRIAEKAVHGYTHADVLGDIYSATGASHKFVGMEEGELQSFTRRHKVIFDSAEHEDATNDVYKAWSDIMWLSEYEGTAIQPTHREKVISRLANARQNKNAPLALYVPWEANETGDFSRSNESPVLHKLLMLHESLNARDIDNTLLLVPQNMHIDINEDPLARERIINYFSGIMDLGGQGVEVKSSSDLRREHKDAYAVEVAQQRLRPAHTGSVLAEGRRAATRLKTYTNPEERNAQAVHLLDERAIEARLVEDVYQPIKVSLTSRTIDKQIDEELPGVYIFRKDMQDPWRQY
jgi:hypothetical protein